MGCWKNSLAVFMLDSVKASPLIALQIACCKLLHKPIDFLRLAWQPEAFEESAQCRHKVLATEVQLVYVAVHHLLTEFGILTEELPNLSLNKGGKRCAENIIDLNKAKAANGK